ncbi:MAG: DbpA RNA binding domain-containing protein [Gemmatimonadales bacterium]
MEQEGRELAAVSRGQNTVYVAAHDWAGIAQFLEPLVEKLGGKLDGAGEPSDVELLILSADPESAAAIAAEAAKLVEGRDVGLLAATSAPRAARLLHIRPSRIVVGTPTVIAELLRGAAIKLGAVRQVCIAWADELAAGEQTTALESVMTEVPKDAARTVVAAELSPAVAELVERYARRARRVAPPEGETTESSAVEFVTTSDGAKLGTLRRVLDELNPSTALVFVRERGHEREVGDLLRSLGYASDDAPVRLGLVAAPGTEVAILFDLPASKAELREAVSGARRAVAMVQPRQLTSLRLLAAGGVVSPVSLAESGQRARDRDARMRRELHDALTTGQFGRELIALEPLLDEFDGIEIAAAALQLLERDRAARLSTESNARPANAATAGQPSASAGRSAERASGAMVRLFVNVGTRDGVRPAELVGALTHEAGLAGTDVGRIDLRESHAIVEVAAGSADAAIEKVTGASIRGRRVVVRREEERPRPSGRLSDRPARDFSRGGRSDREPRGRGDSRGPRGPRGGPRRPRHEGGE